MPMLERTIRTVVSIVAVTVIAVNLFGIVAVWFIERRATDVALKGFGLVETAAAAINAGVARVDGFVTTSRTEVKQAAETITAVGREAAANSPVLIALNERLETSLAPRIGQMQQTLAPVRDAMAKIGVAIEMANSLPMLAGLYAAAGRPGRCLQPARSVDRGPDPVARHVAGGGRVAKGPGQS